MIKKKANAKINLTLDILGIRADGYHEVEMVMQEIELFDEITIEKAKEGITVIIDRDDLPTDEGNLAYRAAKLFLNVHSIQEGVKINIKKNIPIAAGLAGGSTDAAAVLVGLDELFKLNLTKKELCLLGETLGSDVPFCIMGSTMLATSRGEVLTKLPPMPEVYVVLAKPPISVSTAWAYRTYDEMGVSVHPNNKAFIKALEKGDLDEIFPLLGNVLEEVTRKKHKEIDEYKKLMTEYGAPCAMMSGSGPTVFALTKERVLAEKIADALSKKINAESIFVVKTIGRKEGF